MWLQSALYLLEVVLQLTNKSGRSTFRKILKYINLKTELMLVIENHMFLQHVPVGRCYVIRNIYEAVSFTPFN